MTHLQSNQDQPLGSTGWALRRKAALLMSVGVAAAVLAGCGASGPEPTISLQVVSSAPDRVSGGDARVRVTADVSFHGDVELWLNGRKLNVPLTANGDQLEGLVSGMNDGANTLEARIRNGRSKRTLQLTNHPITGPMFSGPQQTPFVCTTIQSAVARQPLVDSATAPGYKVTDASGAVVGYSRNCSIDTFVAYHYRNTSGAVRPMPADGSRPADMGTVTLADGRTVDFVIRREIGSINRFLYSIAMLAPRGESPTRPDLSLWNKKLLYWFQGGVAVGYSQGTVHGGSMNADILAKGYAIVHSSGNNTGTHYNLAVASETAMMTKERFIERYGVPIYTVGLGGSGGAIAQYHLAQNHPGVLDALLPVQSYPDMVTQTIHIGDCELLEHYMDATDRTNPKWRTTKNRSWLVGLNAEENIPGGPNTRVNDPLAAAKTQLGYSTAVGTTECLPGWRGLTPLSMNPRYGQVANQANYEPQSAIAAIRWTHYDDLRNIYGVDSTGAAYFAWDNVGVMYGLKALKGGQISGAEFLNVNWHIGGWKEPNQMVQEGFPYVGSLSPTNFDPWSRRNMNLAPDANTPAPRTAGNPGAMRAAYTSGHVFSGRLPVPALDHRQYMERELDMHNAHQSFAVRKRVTQNMGSSDNLVIWFTDTMPGTPKFSQTLEALDVMDQWMGNILANPTRSIAANKPTRAVDSCFNTAGTRLHAGDDVWNGILDTKAAGACTRAFPLYGTSRTVAGAPIEGGIYRCALKSVDLAATDGTFSPWSPNAAEVARLKQIFPAGVCDYTLPDQARPS
ncbi:MAG: hypothetical protein FJY26_06495 [Betaproteobacteria bacterium]|nr:hypothetical protein [Betaproteobacteria bacterium]